MRFVGIAQPAALKAYKNVLKETHALVMCYEKEDSYVNKATDTKRKNQDDCSKKQWRQGVKKLLTHLGISLFFYVLSFILSFIPVAVDYYYTTLSNISNDIENSLMLDFLLSALYDSFCDIGTTYISISFLFILLMDFAKDLILNRHNVGSVAICIIVIEVLAGCVGLIIFCLVMSSMSVFDANENQYVFFTLTRMYLIIACISLVLNTIIGNSKMSTKSSEERGE